MTAPGPAAAWLLAHPGRLWLAFPLLALALWAEARGSGTRARRRARFAVRALVLALLLLAVAEPSWTSDVAAPRRLVVAVDDAGLAAPRAREEAAAEERSARDAAAGARLPIERVASTDGPAAALAAARLAFAPGERGAVLLLTDGRGDERATAAAAEAMRRDGIAVEGIALPREQAPPVPEGPRVTDLAVPDEARGPFALRARVDAPGPVDVEVRVDGERRADRRVEGAGPRDVSFPDLEARPGVHEVGVVVRDADGRAALSRGLVTVGAPPRVLALLEVPERSLVRRALSARGVEVAAVRSEGLAEALAAAPEIDAVVADAAALAAAPPAALAALAHRVEDGLGLFLEAGADEAAWERLAASPLADVLPVRPRPRPPPPPPPTPATPPEEPPPPLEKPQPEDSPGLAAEHRPEEALPISLLVVIDRSGSMVGDKLAMAIEGARRAAETLSPFDRVGVITFADEASVDVPMQSAGAVGNLTLRLLGVQADGNTDIYGALQRGGAMLKAERSPIKHLILLTDGGQNVGRPLFGPLVQAMSRAGVTVTAIGLGAGHDDVLLKRIAQWSARGIYRDVDTADQLPTILTRDTRRVAEDRSQEARALARVDTPERPRPKEPPKKPDPSEGRRATPPSPPPSPPPAAEGPATLPLRALRPHEATAGLDRAALPAVGPPRASDPVPGNQTALLLAREDGAAVLAARRAGLGRTIAWLLPPDDPGAAAWDGLGPLLVQAVRSVRAPDATLARRIAAEAFAGADGDVLRVETPEEGPVEAVWHGTRADGTEAEVPLGPLRAGEEATLSLPAARPGTVATVRLTAPGGRSGTATYLAAERTPEDRAGDAAALARALGGPAAEVRRWANAVEPARSPSPRPVGLALLVAVLALLPLDVALHRRSASRA